MSENPGRLSGASGEAREEQGLCRRAARLHGDGRGLSQGPSGQHRRVVDSRVGSANICFLGESQAPLAGLDTCPPLLPDLQLRSEQGREGPPSLRPSRHASFAIFFVQEGS